MTKKSLQVKYKPLRRNSARKRKEDIRKRVWFVAVAHPPAPARQEEIDPMYRFDTMTQEEIGKLGFKDAVLTHEHGVIDEETATYIVKPMPVGFIQSHHVDRSGRHLVVGYCDGSVRSSPTRNALLGGDLSEVSMTTECSYHPKMGYSFRLDNVALVPKGRRKNTYIIYASNGKQTFQLLPESQMTPTVKNLVFDVKRKIADVVHSNSSWGHAPASEDRRFIKESSVAPPEANPLYTDKDSGVSKLTVQGLGKTISFNKASNLSNMASSSGLFNLNNASNNSNQQGLAGESNFSGKPPTQSNIVNNNMTDNTNNTNNNNTARDQQQQLGDSKDDALGAADNKTATTEQGNAGGEKRPRNEEGSEKDNMTITKEEYDGLLKQYVNFMDRINNSTTPPTLEEIAELNGVLVKMNAYKDHEINSLKTYLSNENRKTLQSIINTVEELKQDPESKQTFESLGMTDEKLSQAYDTFSKMNPEDSQTMQNFVKCLCAAGFNYRDSVERQAKRMRSMEPDVQPPPRQPPNNHVLETLKRNAQYMAYRAEPASSFNSSPMSRFTNYPGHSNSSSQSQNNGFLASTLSSHNNWSPSNYSAGNGKREQEESLGSYHQAPSISDLFTRPSTANSARLC